MLQQPPPPMSQLFLRNPPPPLQPSSFQPSTPLPPFEGLFFIKSMQNCVIFGAASSRWGGVPQVWLSPLRRLRFKPRFNSKPV